MIWVYGFWWLGFRDFFFYQDLRFRVQGRGLQGLRRFGQNGGSLNCSVRLTCQSWGTKMQLLLLEIAQRDPARPDLEVQIYMVVSQ